MTWLTKQKIENSSYQYEHTKYWIISHNVRFMAEWKSGRVLKLYRTWFWRYFEWISEYADKMRHCFSHDDCLSSRVHKNQSRWSCHYVLRRGKQVWKQEIGTLQQVEIIQHGRHPAAAQQDHKGFRQMGSPQTPTCYIIHWSELFLGFVSIQALVWPIRRL